MFVLRFFLLAFLVLLPTTSSAKDIGECDNVVEAVQTRWEERKEKASEVYDEMIQLPSKEDLENCIDGISISDSISIGIPSFGDLLKEACDYINSLVKEEISGFQDNIKYSPLPGFSLEAGGGIDSSGSAGASKGYYEYESDVQVETRSGPSARDVINMIEEIP